MWVKIIIPKKPSIKVKPKTTKVKPKKPWYKLYT